jgi:hypothetical protein
MAEIRHIKKEEYGELGEHKKRRVEIGNYCRFPPSEN